MDRTDGFSYGSQCGTPMKNLFNAVVPGDIHFPFGQASSTPRRHIGLQSHESASNHRESLAFDQLACTMTHMVEQTNLTGSDQPYANSATNGARLYSVNSEDLQQSQNRQVDAGSTLISSSSPPPTASFSPPSDDFAGLASSVSTDDGRWTALDLRINRDKRNTSSVPANSDMNDKKPQRISSEAQSNEFHIQALLSSNTSSSTGVPSEQGDCNEDCKILPFSNSNLAPETTFGLLHAMNILLQYFTQKKIDVPEYPKPSSSNQVHFAPTDQNMRVESSQSNTVSHAPVHLQPSPTWPVRTNSVNLDTHGMHHHQHIPHHYYHYSHHHSFVHGHAEPQQHCRSIMRTNSPCIPDVNLQVPTPGGIQSSDRFAKACVARHRTEKTGSRTRTEVCSVVESTSNESGRSHMLSNTDLSEDDAPGKGPVILYYPEPADSKKHIRAMLARNDPRLRYVNDGAAIRNPFAVDRKIQLNFLTNLLCIKTEDGNYLCKGCNRTTSRLRPMQQHLLSHSASKFNLCVRCLKGFNDKYDMKRHTRKHTLVRPYVCPECGRSFSQRCSLEGHRRKIHQVRLNYTRNQRREVVRVCESCGFACSSPAEMVRHTVALHPTSSGLPRLQRQLARIEERARRAGDSGARLTGIHGHLRSNSSDQYILSSSYMENQMCHSSVDELETNRTNSEFPLSVAAFASELNSFADTTGDEDEDVLDLEDSKTDAFKSVTSRERDGKTGSTVNNDQDIENSLNDPPKTKGEQW